MQPAVGKSTLPKMAGRLTNHPLANMASSKRAEVVLMRRYDVVQESAPVNSDAKQAYKQFYADELVESHFEVVRELITRRCDRPALSSESMRDLCPTRQLYTFLHGASHSDFMERPRAQH